MRVILAVLLALPMSTNGYAQTFEESLAAYNSKNFATAFFGFKKLADQGAVAAQTNLGWMYVNGQDVPKDGQQALFWFRKAADQGNVDAQYNIGQVYRKGDGVPKNDQQAVFWYRKAC